ncbi:TPA: PTS sugar transporter subunit IIC [Vibrio parahaemolyticus]|uniref:PTS sugar transporter subunit IIC n=1 Tax=Vibrio harveyi group TaxID=717610 RepID=UPI0010E703CB|nr:PTS sugar transporter subunit IIC [Vibrio parahaemolyticus]EHZ2746612.1 PTS sugar transporter subunit IIC [Vibrio vulnificus]EIA0836522.1 PTS sugar transporter subunit IIC [Vibrio parahaemolyticus]EIV8646587.1 PTS sugar transporter subunit IIC [Vibrio parahaemolyticus]EIV8675763.1 PTS sugar transporter subunit IIC [Vibrio parahaemolyticus]ELA6986267.1 PTS sugar transporter subunit IIC [Vibrio parahaemolyticus]
MSFEKKVEYFKSGLQYSVGIYIFSFVVIKAWAFIGFPTAGEQDPQIIKHVLSTSILSLVSQAVMVSAAIELAYMLFTPGPDEAVDPLILGIAGTALLVMSDENTAKTDSMLYDSIAVLLFVLSLAILFYLRFMLTKWFPKQFKDNFDKGSAEGQVENVASICDEKKAKSSEAA